MTVSIPELALHHTSSLASHCRFYPAEITVPHHQLRNFISTVYENRVYFVHNFNVSVLDLETQQRSLVAVVPFEARCLAAAHGWVCVGGETKGDCAFIKIGGGKSRDYLGHDLVVEMLGKEIVNSMTIHQMPDRDSGQRGETVVLISNNDKSVTLYSLTQRETLAVLEHPVPMNYAAMSPDCSIIAAVGDSHEVYFYQRRLVDNGEIEGAFAEDYPEYDWRPFAVPKIPAGEGVWDDFSFAVAFSPSGHLCAVSAQGGAITVFDMHAVMKFQSRAEDAIMCTFKSSRSGLWGCVRSMAFSPEPWDLLAWTEDHGNIGIADLRHTFVRRQILALDRDASDIIDPEDATPTEYRNLDVKERLKLQHLQMSRGMRGHPPVGANSFDDTSRPSTQRATPSSNQDTDLDARERSVVQALETTIDDMDQYSVRPYSVNYTSSPTFRPSASLVGNTREYDVQLLNPTSHAQRSHVPRRRTSVVLSDSTSNRNLAPPENMTSQRTASPAPMSEDTSTPPMSTNDLTPSGNNTSQPLPYNIPRSDPWHVIEQTLALDRATDRTGSLREHPAGLAQIEAAIYAERQLSRRLEGQLEDERRLSELLRTELEQRERLLEARQLDLRHEQSGESRLSPSLERVLQRQLQSEQENGRQRLNEIESEIRNTSERVQRLQSEHELLEHRLRWANLGTEISATPTTNDSNARDLETILRQMEHERQARNQRIQVLGLQVRRAESRIGAASVQTNLERTDSAERFRSHLDARFLSGPRTGSSGSLTRRVTPQTSTAENSLSAADTGPSRARIAAFRRAELAMNADRSTIPRTSELSGRASESDTRLARAMLQRAMMETNSNWVAGVGLRRILGTNRNMGVGIPRNPTSASALEEMMRESGIGSAGIGWSPNGNYLYAGSEVGIFEFKVNIRDRMQFPSIEMR